MMTLSKLRTVISEISTFQNKVAYRAFPVGEAPALPFVCYLATNTNNFDADNKVYAVIQNVDVELYTATKSETTEAALETALNDNGLVWEKSEVYLEDENCYEIIYTLTL